MTTDNRISRSNTAGQKTAESPALRPAGISFSHFVVIGLWIGVTTGLAEVFLVAVKKLVFHAYVHRGAHFVWAAPLTYATVMMTLGVVFGILHRLLPRWATLRLFLTVAWFIGFWSLLLLTGKISDYAKVLLAGGLAVHVSYLLTRRPNWLILSVRWTFGWTGCIRRLFSRDKAAVTQPSASMNLMPSRRDLFVSSAASVGALAIGANAWDHVIWQRHRPSGATPPPGAPNVLLLVLDTVRASSLSLYGYQRNTSPNLEKIAKLGVRFDRAYATTSWTLPSHASMFTGRYPTELSCDWTIPLNSKHETLAEVLSKNGYETAGFIGNNYYCSRESGLARGFQHYEDYTASAWHIPKSIEVGKTGLRQLENVIGHIDNLGRKSAEHLTTDFVKWLSQRQDQRPFFGFLNFYDAHDPYSSAPDFAKEFGGSSSSGIYDPDKIYTASDVKNLNDTYDSAIAYLDHQLGRLFLQLEQKAILKDTVVIIVGDHGEHFGEHNLLSHGNSLYSQVLNVPLIMINPNSKCAGTSIQSVTSLLDIPSTILSICGIQSSRFRGINLCPSSGSPIASLAAHESAYSFLTNRWAVSTTSGTRVLPTPGIQVSIVDKVLHFIHDPKSGDELYDLRRDPSEQHDLASTDDGRHEIKRYREQLAAIRGRLSDQDRQLMNKSG